MGSITAVFRNGQIELIEPVDWPDGTRVAVTPIDITHDSEEDAWALLGTARLEEEWNNPEDAIYDDWKRLYGV